MSVGGGLVGAPVGGSVVSAGIGDGGSGKDESSGEASTTCDPLAVSVEGGAKMVLMKRQLQQTMHRAGTPPAMGSRSLFLLRLGGR